jgi:DNA polymerase epsilon subunit 1
MLKIPITVSRVFYLNSKAPVTEEFLGRRVNKILPHGRHSYNLYEVCLVLWLLNYNDGAFT